MADINFKMFDKVTLRGFKEPFIFYKESIVNDIYSIDLEDYNGSLCNSDDEKYDIMKVEGFRQTENGSYDFITLYERSEEILTKNEKEYLSKLINPFKKKVRYIEKIEIDDNTCYLFLGVGKYGNENDSFALPNFNSNKYYKDMEKYKKYTIEELEL